MGDATDVKRLGWRQGAVFPPELVSAVAGEICRQCTEPEPLNNAWLVVVTQDCDLVHGSFEVEPFVELVIGRPVERADPVKMFGRNPRVLDLLGLAGEDRVPLRFNVHEKARVSRLALSDHAPCASHAIDEEDVDTITEWLAKRYTRAAFPDGFNERLIPAHKKIDKLLKKSGELITGIFLALSSWEELSEHDDYKVILRATARVQDLSHPDVEEDLASVVDAVAKTMGGCTGVAVIDAKLVSESSFTLDDMRMMQRWDFDFRSRSGQPGGEIVPST